MADSTSFTDFSLRENQTPSNHLEVIPQYPPSIVAVRVTFITVTVILSLVSNTLCLITLPSTRSNIPENNRLLMLCLSAADLGVGLISALSIAPAILGYWPYGDIFCMLSSSFMNIFSGISIYSLILISLDRYLAVTKPLRYPAIVTRKKVTAAIVIMWVADLLICLTILPFLGAPVEYNMAAAKCTPLWRPEKDSVVLLVTLTGTIIVPFFLMIFIYARLFLITRAQIKWMRQMSLQRRHLDNKNSQAISTHSDRKSSRTFFAITIVFGLAWLPYTITAFYQNFTGKLVHETLQFVVTWAAASSSWTDVVTFAGMNSSFRHAIKRLFMRGCVKCVRSSNHVEPSNLSVSEKSKETFSETK